MGSIDGIAAIGLGPTLLGLSAIMLLAAVPWLVRLVQRSAKPEAPDQKDAFDADAALARYMARRELEGEVVPVDGDDAAAVRPAFGRKTA